MLLGGLKWSYSASIDQIFAPNLLPLVYFDIQSPKGQILFGIANGSCAIKVVQVVAHVEGLNNFFHKR